MVIPDNLRVVLFKLYERDLVLTLGSLLTELNARMKKAGVLPFFEGLSFTNRKEYARWISEAKKDETRERRLAKAIELLTKGVRNPH